MVILRLSIPLLFAAGVMYGAYKGIRHLEKKYVLKGREEPKLLEASPEDEAKAIAERIRAAIKRKKDSGGDLAEDFEKNVTQILTKRIPRIAENQRRLTRYLLQIDEKSITSEPEKLKKRIKECSDDELKSVLEKNLVIALERLENLHHLEILKEKTQAQINLIIMGLKNVEDKVESLRLVEGKVDSVSGALENVSIEVKTLEEEYKEMNIHYDE